MKFYYTSTIKIADAPSINPLEFIHVHKIIASVYEHTLRLDARISNNQEPGR